MKTSVLSNFHQSKRRLAILWTLFVILIFTILLVQTLNGLYQGFETKPLEWFSRNVISTYFLILSSTFVDALNKNESRQVERPYFLLAYFLSFVYLLFVLYSIISRLFNDFAPLEVLDISEIYLSQFHVIVVVSLSVFFFKEPQKEE